MNGECVSVRGVLVKTSIATVVGAALFVGSVVAGATSVASSEREIAFIHDGKLSLVDAAGGPVRPLTKARDVSTFEWSPDGTRLVFVRAILVGYDREYEIRRPAIFVANADGSGERRLSPRGTHDKNPRWSPDGRKIVFERAADLVDGLRDDIWVMNADGLAARRLTHHPVLDRKPVWSPDGRKIAWVRGWPDALHVMVMNADGSRERRLLGSQLQTTNPAWSPDGRLLAVTGFDTEALYYRATGRDRPQPLGEGTRVRHRRGLGPRRSTSRLFAQRCICRRDARPASNAPSAPQRLLN